MITLGPIPGDRMQFDDRRPQLGYRGSVSSRARDIFLKTGAVIVGGVALVGAFVLSLAFFAIAVGVAVMGGGYLWWKTRDLRKQMRAAAQAQMSQQQQSHGDVIEGVVISREHSDEDMRHR